MGYGFQVRPEGDGDFGAIRTVNREAFGTVAEADLVDALRANGDAALSLVAEDDSGVVGHILFSHLPIRTTARDVAAVALAPMSVLPRWQRRGVGSALVRAGLASVERPVAKPWWFSATPPTTRASASRPAWLSHCRHPSPGPPSWPWNWYPVP